MCKPETAALHNMATTNKTNIVSRRLCPFEAAGEFIKIRITEEGQ
jgi:hypothetical protein